MLYNYIKISLRNILRHKLFSGINIFGLTLSMSICLVVLMVINNQMNFDKFHPHSDRTYRVITEVLEKNDAPRKYATSPMPLAENLLEEYDYVEAIARFFQVINHNATAGGKVLPVSGSFTDPGFFEIFGFQLKKGSTEAAFSNPYSVVLTQETANRFFGNEDPFGETFALEGMGVFTVTGVLEPIKENTHMDFDVLASINTVPLLDQRFRDIFSSWGEFDWGYSFILLKPEVGFNTINAVLTALSERITNNTNFEEPVKGYVFNAQALDDITPGKDLSKPMSLGKTRSAMELFYTAVFVFAILLMACFNYTNLSIASSLKRAREVGMYKVMGAFRYQIFMQFIIQATLISVICLLLAYAILPFIPLPESLMQEVQNITPDITLVGWSILFTLFTGLLAGGVPAWLLSSFQPVEALKNVTNVQMFKGLTFRKVLVVFQLIISLVGIITASVLYRQYQFVATADYGFQVENILNLELQGTDYQLLKNELSGIAGVEQISAISDPLGYRASNSVKLQKNVSEPAFTAKSYSVDPNHISNMSLTLLAGSNFPETTTTGHERHIIINEKVLTLLKWDNPSNAVGQSIWLNDTLQVEVAGVLKDFNFEEMVYSIRPLVLRYQPSKFKYLNIRIVSHEGDGILENIESAWNKVAPQIPIKYGFSDKQLYESHSHEGGVASIAFCSLIALILAGLGILGMVTYTIEVRTREVGIRKILGASVYRIILLVSKEFMWLLLIAGILGIPAGYWVGQQLVSNVPYHITIGVGTLSLGGILLLITGLLAIGIQTCKVALANPVEALRKV